MIVFLALAQALLCFIGAQHAEATAYELLVDPADQSCDADSDCSLIYDRCDSCSCGIGVSNQHQDAYSEKLEELCKNFTGAHCDRICAPVALKCRDSRCVVVSAGQQTP